MREASCPRPGPFPAHKDMNTRSTIIVNLGILAHVDAAGKTSPTERLLHATGGHRRPRQRRRGQRMATDSPQPERRRGITISAPSPRSISATCRSTSSTRPATPTSSRRSVRALGILDAGAVLVILGSGAQPQTRVDRGGSCSGCAFRRCCSSTRSTARRGRGRCSRASPTWSPRTSCQWATCATLAPRHDFLCPSDAREDYLRCCRPADSFDDDLLAGVCRRERQNAGATAARGRDDEAWPGLASASFSSPAITSLPRAAARTANCCREPGRRRGAVRGPSSRWSAARRRACRRRGREGNRAGGQDRTARRRCRRGRRPSASIAVFGQGARRAGNEVGAGRTQGLGPAWIRTTTRWRRGGSAPRVSLLLADPRNRRHAVRQRDRPLLHLPR